MPPLAEARAAQHSAAAPAMSKGTQPVVARREITARVDVVHDRTVRRGADVAVG
jgi:hypothetical protein